MTENAIPEQAQKPEKIEVNPGERMVICRCLKSSNLPFCDGSHRQEGCTIKPVIIEGKGA